MCSKSSSNCFRSAIACSLAWPSPLKFSHDFPLASNVTLAFGNVLFGFSQVVQEHRRFPGE
jgi:hypothetical protein